MKEIIGSVCAAISVVAAISEPTGAQQNLHFTYLWHLEQPIYWPDQQTGGADRYERAWESITARDGGRVNPTNNLRDIFGLPDRVAAYQYRCRDSINAFAFRGPGSGDDLPEAGAQVSFSGGLIENLQSLGAANQLGYGNNWFQWKREARNWSTTGGPVHPRMDIVLFGFHHPLLPLLDDSAVRKSIQLYKSVYPDAWGASPGVSKGFFPSEMAFSTRLIPILAAEGIEWSFVSSEKISRACANFPVIFGSGGINCDPPNRADQVNPAQSNWFRQQIDRGCSPAEAYPYAFTPHRAQYVNPESGAISSIVVVPCSQILGWRDGYSPQGIGDFNTLNAQNNPSRPMLAVMAHDGDNAWGGGYSYYLEATINRVNSAAAAGYVPTTVQRYLSDHPVPAGDVVHVEDGAWVNADGDFGAPQFINWNWPLLSASGQVDIPNGWHIDARNWAVITASQNRVDTAEQIHTDRGGTVNVRKILYPDAATNGVERAWHYFLGGLNSGYMYYGTAEDFEIKPTVSGNEAMQHADPIIASQSESGSGSDRTAPTVWIPQRFPWNPGSTNFGPQFGYQQVNNNGDFHIWTFAYDASGITSVTLKYRLDTDGTNPLSSTQNETFAGGVEVGAWQSLPMNFRDFPAGNVYNDGSIVFSEMPQYIADQYWVQLTGIRSQLVDYYIEATDSKGNLRRSPIQHVWVGDGSGSAPTGSCCVGTACSVTTQAACSGSWTSGASCGPTTCGTIPPPSGFVMDGVLDPGTALVASNNGMWIRAALGSDGDVLYVAAPDAGEGNDHFLFFARTPGALRAAPWAKAGQVADWDAFLADENNNDYESWFDAGVGVSVQAATGSNGGVIEGTINLRQELAIGSPPAPLPTTIALAVAPYGNNDGGALLSGFQAPAGNGNGTLEAGEYVVVTLCDLPGAPAALCCPLDLSGNGVVDADDIFAFLGVWFAGPPGGACSTPPPPPPQSGCQADWNGDGIIDADDVFTFLASWFVAGPGSGC